MKVSPRGRVCEITGCNTVLSVYNEAARCSVHEIPRSFHPKTRG